MQELSRPTSLVYTADFARSSPVRIGHANCKAMCFQSRFSQCIDCVVSMCFPSLLGDRELGSLLVGFDFENVNSGARSGQNKLVYSLPEVDVWVAPKLEKVKGASENFGEDLYNPLIVTKDRNLRKRFQSSQNGICFCTTDIVMATRGDACEMRSNIPQPRFRKTKCPTYEDFSRGHKLLPVYNPTFILFGALPSMGVPLESPPPGSETRPRPRSPALRAPGLCRSEPAWGHGKNYQHGVTHTEGSRAPFKGDSEFPLKGFKAPSKGKQPVPF